MRNGLLRASLISASILGAALALAPGWGLARARPVSAVEQIVIHTAKPVNSFAADQALGAGLDGMGPGEIEQLYTPFNVEKMRSAGLVPVTYRLRTELGLEAWHWGPEGAWSDPARAQGYWVSSDRPKAPIMTSFGYSLPRRGDTFDNANNDGFSRLDDRDPASFWKTNPYLDPRYTGETAAQPQWAVIEFPQTQAIDGAAVSWAEPYATRYRLQYWVGEDEYDNDGHWVDFPGGVVTDGHGGEAALRLAQAPVNTRFVRLLMTSGSNTALDKASTDIRDRLGYAVAEIGLGLLGPDGRLADVVRHGRTSASQTVIHVSSNDPWHRAVDRDDNLQQPGFDRVFGSGLTNGLPMLLPVPVLFDTPENAAAEIRFLKNRGYPIRRIELGEEPDGQYIDAATYGALFLETARAVHAVDPTLITGGPSMQNGIANPWLDADPNRSWTSRLMRYLRDRGGMANLGFFSFERYPFDNLCGDLQAKLQDQTRMMTELFARLRKDGVPTDIPWLITEYGFSAFSGQAMVETPSALYAADIVGQFLTQGGEGAYMFGYGPSYPANQHLACAGFGNMMLFEADEHGQAKWPMPSYYAAQLMSRVWAQPGAGRNSLHAAALRPGSGADATLIGSYALHRPDGRWALMLVNRDSRRAHRIDVRFQGASGALTGFKGPVDLYQYSSAQYAWHADGENGHPIRDLPPAHSRIAKAGPVTLPPFSLTVLVGR